jgi:hypothetical protein
LTGKLTRDEPFSTSSYYATSLNNSHFISQGGSKKTDAGVVEKVKKSKLENLGTYSLYGNIASMQVVRLAGAVRDAILMSFKDAKVGFS